MSKGTGGKGTQWFIDEFELDDAEIAEDYSTASWIGNSQIIMNSNSGWYSAGGSGNTAFHGANLGTFSTETSLTMGGQIQTYGDNDADGHVVLMNYSVYPSSSSASTWHSQELAWYDYANNNNWFGTSDGASRPAVIDISTIAAGTYKLEVYFSQQTGANSWLYETYDVHNYVANFTIGATLSRTPTSLSGFSTVSGTASEAQSFSVTATHLNGNLTVTAPTGYEVSTSSGSGYAGSVTLSRDANNKVTGQTVYVRLKSSASAGTYNGNVTVSGGGTTQVTVALTGSVAAAVPEIDVESSHAFGSVVVGENKTETITVRNTGTAALTISGVTFSGTGSGQFTVTPTTATVAAGGSQNLSVKFSPTAVGSYSVTMSIANNDSDENPKTVTLTATGSVGTPVVTPGTVTKTATTATVPATVNAKGANTTVSFEYGTTTSYGTSGTVTGGDVSGNVVGAAQTAQEVSVSLENLKANTTYYYRWTANNGNSGTAEGSFSTECMSAGPVVTPTPGNGTATFTWADVGAVQYLLSLWTGGGGGSSTLVSENFQNFSSVGSYSTTESSQTINGKTWAYTSCIIAPTAAANGSGTKGNVQMQASNGILVFPPSLNGVKTVKVVARGGNSIKLQQNVNGSWTTLETWSLTSSGAEYTHTFSTAQNGVSLRIRADTSNAKYVHDVTILGESVTYVTGYGAEGAEVTSPVTVSGLTPGTTYNWSLKAVGGGTGCEEDGTAADGYDDTVTPTAADEAPVWATTVGPWSATVDTQLSKTMTEYLSTLGSPAPSFTVAAQGTAPAGSYGVTSAGVFTFTPAEGDAGKSFVFRFTASNSEGNPTKDVTVNVGALAPTIAEGTKTLGTTSATLPVTVNMRGGATSADITLVYGKTTSYGSSASVSPTRITTGLNAGTAVTGTIASGLEPGTTYSYKWTVKNSAGTTTKTGTFTTLDVAPAVASAGSLDTTVAPGATATLAASSWVTAGTHLRYTLSSSVQASLYTWTAGTGTLAFTPTAAGTYVFDLKASNGQGNATYRWTVTVANAPTVTKGEASTSGTTATVPATINAGGALTTVSFVYGTSESYGSSGTVTGGDVSGHADQVSAGQTARAVGVSLSGLTQGTTYYYKWTAVNAGGTTEVAGSFFQPGDGLEFPGQMNGWAQSGTTVRDAEFGGGNYYYTPAVRLTSDQLFKAYKGGTWYGNGYWVTGNNSGHVFTVNENTAENKLCVTETGGGFPPSGAGYYTLRGHDTGSGIEYVALYTENAPVTFTGASDNHAARGTADVTVTATLSGAKSASEKVYVRYSTDGWTTSALVQMSGSGTSYTGTIPGQNKGTTVEWYVLTSPHDALADHVDLCTLRGLKNGTDNFTYTTALLPPTVDTVEAGYEKVSLGWNLNAAGNAVMIIRYSSLLPTITPPSDGTAYAADTSALGGTVVYGAYADPSAHPSLENVVSQGTGYTYVFYSVEGSGGSSKYSEGVVRTAQSLSLATPEVAAVETGEVTMDGAARTGETYVLLRNTANSFSGSVSGGLPSVGATWGGATVMYVGTTEDYTDTSVTGCGTYYYKVWLKAAGEDVWKGSAVDSTTIPTPAAPVLSALSGITYQGFTASWNAVPGAVTYRMDITTGTAPTTTSDTLTRETTGVTSGSTTYTAWNNKTGASGAKYAGKTAGSNNSIQMNNTSGNGIWTTVSGGTARKVTISWESHTSSGRYITVYGSNDAFSGDSGGTSLGTITAGTSTELTLTGDYKYLRFKANNALYVSALTVDWEAGGSVSKVWDNVDVSSLMTVSGGVVSVPVTGLEELTTYSVTVRAEGSTAACASADSNTQSATTLENDTVTTVTISDADGDGGTTAVAAGAVAAGQTVLVQGTKLVVASGSVNPSLTGMTFTTTGTAGTDDLATFQVRVGTSATFAGTETVKGTVTAGAAGSHTVTFGSAQTLTAGQTYYVWIEAVTKAGATGGNTVGVAALAKDAFAMTGARKNGSTVATGLQTIGNLTAFGAATGASAGGQVDLTWTAGAGGSVLVRWSDVSLEAIPAPGTAWANEATGLTGGSYTVSGVTGCKTHYFKAWEVIDGVACGTARTGTAAASAPAAPTGLGHGTPGAHNASLTWSAAAGAAGYAIDLWHYEGGSSGEGETATYTLATKTSVTVTGTRPTGATEEFTSTYSTVGQMTSGNSQTLTLHGYAGVRITKLMLSMKSNSNGGAGSLTVQVGSGEPVEIVNGAFNTAWHTGWSTSYVDIELPVDVAVGTGEDVVFHIDASANSLYCQSYSVTYSSGTRVDDVIGGVVQAGSAVTVAASGATGVNLGGLADGTTYGWDVKALGTECESAASASDTFTTAELLGAPTIVEPLTPGVEQLGGTITGAAGATMILKRYESSDAAMAGTADGSLGGVVVPTTPGAAGTWTFADTGLDGCKTYYYRAWQKATVEGEQATSSGSNVASGKTELGTPVVTALGAGTTILLSWAEVKGAASYDVTVSSDASFTPGAATTRVSEDFDEKNPSGWTFSGTGWYDAAGSSMKYGSSGCAVKFDTDGDSVTTPTFTAGATSLSFWMKASDSGSSLVIEALEGGEWKAVRTVSAGTTGGGETVDLSDHATATQLRFTISKGKGNIGLDHVTVTGPGAGGTIVFTSTVTAAPYSATVPGLEQGHTYYYQVTAHGSGDCDDTTAEGQATPENAALIQVSPKHYNFGTVNKNEGGATATFTVRNTGNRELTFTGVDLVQDGTAYSITEPATAAARTAAIPAGGERTYTVKFEPVVSGTRTAALQFLCNAANAAAVEGQSYKKVEIPLEGTCYDPATADPTVYWLEVEDELGIEDTVTDQSMAHEDHEPVLTVLTWHYNRSYRKLDGSSKAARWTLYDPSGNVATKANGAALENQPFTAVEDYVYDGKTCAKFSAPIPALGTGKAVRGTYTVKVKVWDSTGTYWTETTHFVPIETGWLFDDFTRADREATGSGALENGWTAMTSGGAVAGEAAIHADALELYGANGECPGVAGRIAVARDMSDVGYATDPHDFVGTGSWGFHFKTGAKTVGFGDGSTAGAFVLGSTASTWLTATPGQVGYAVAMRDDAVQLVKFEGSLLANGTITQLGEAQFAGTQGKLLAVRVDFLPGQDEVDADAADDGVAHDAVPAKFRLYVKEVAKTGGSPIAECTAADKVLEYEFPAPEDHDLRYAGMMWNHGVAQVSDKTGAMFDDIYLPHMEGQTEPMMFHVIDEDTEGPEFYGISLRGAVAAPDVAAHGLTVTGMVHDASGVVGTVAWAMYNGETLLTSGTATPAAVSGSTTEYTLSCAIPAGRIDGSIRSADCRFVLTASDGDDDRSENSVNIDSAEGTGSFPFTLCASTPAAPAWATAEADGAEMVVLRWARAAAGTQYIVVRSDEEIGDNASPQGRKGEGAMAEGTTVEGWGTVVYNGTGDNHLTGTWTAREFVVAPGSANYFAVYGMTGDETTGYYFSAPTKPNAYKWETTDEGTGETTVHTAVDGSGVPVASSVTEGGWPCTTAKYEPGEGVDAFAYRTSVPEIGDEDPQNLALEFNYETRPETGSGWGGPWTGDVGTWKVHDGSLLSEGTHYPAPTGNKLYWHDTSHEESTSTEVKLTRPLKTPDSGEFYMAALMNYFEPNPETGAEGKWIQIALVDASGNDIVSFGMPGWDHNVAAIEYNGGQYCGAENIDRDGYHLYSGHGNDYVVVGQLSREDHKFRMWAYWGGSENTTTIPELYSKKDNNVEVDVSVERTALNTVQADFDFGENTTLPAVAGIQLRAGSVSGKELGHVYFDEVRFANTWEELFLFNAPEVYTYDFDKPENTSGHLDPENPTDEEGHRQWLISDGALAHGNVGLNAQFGLYHRTGIKEASFTILDAEGNQILKQQQNNAGKTAPETGGTLAWVSLDGTRGRTYSDWSTDAGGAMEVAVPTNKISLDETYTVEVKLKSAGGKEATVTSASETGGAGASDLFFGEYGEGDRWDKYVEIYNGTGHDVDLTQYYLVRLAKDQDFSTYYNKTLGTPACERIFPEGSTDPNHILPHGKTIVLLNNAKIGGTGPDHQIYLDRLAAMEEVLTLSNCLHRVMETTVLDAGGDTAYLLITKEAYDNPDSEGNNAGSAYNKAWIDACGLAQGVVGRTTGKYIMSRKDTAVYLPRSAPDVIDPSEWDYRDWGLGDDDDYDKYENFISTAGWNDRKLGLGGNMEFKVFDDDIEPPTLVRGGVRVRKADGTLEEDYRAVSAGDRTYVVGGWSFTNWPTRSGAEVANLTLAEYEDIATMWPGGLTQNGGLSWASELGGRDLAGWANVIEAGNGKGQSQVEFDGITQRKYGAMIARASGSYAKDDEVWLGFDLDVAQLTDAALTFGFAGGNAGFKNAYVAWSATGEEGSFKMPNEWNFDPNSGGASTWSEWSRSLDTESTGIPASAGHLWFRVYLSDYGTTVGTFRMDNMRVEGAPSVVRVTDAEISGRGMQFEVHVKDEASGLDAGTTGAQSSDDGKAYFDCGLGSTDKYRTVALADGGKSESTISWTAANGEAPVTTGWGPKMAQEWYESTQAGHGKLRLSVPDADDDRAGDQTMLRSDFGMLMVEDDDEAPPVLDMATMKPRQEGTMAEWLLVEKTAVASETMDALAVGTLGLNTTEGTTSRPRYSLRPAADTGLSSPTYAVYQSGWQAESKFWTVRLKNTTAGAGTITKISFAGQVGSVLAPTGYTVKYGTVTAGEFDGEESTTWSGSLLTSGTAWVKEGAAEGTTGSPIKTWKNYEKTVNIPLAASGTAGDEIELRIYGTGTDPKGIGATWYLWDLKIEGTISVAGEGGEDGYTYVTDASLAQPGGANLTMSGSVYDEGSGLGAVPTYELKRGTKTVSSGEITFKAARDLSARTAKNLGEFEQNIAVSGLGYADLALAEYKGTVHAVDADHDREDASGNNMDQQDLDGQFAFTVVDQDLVGPTAPANVTVNGTAVGASAPDRLTAEWSNNPEFLVSFDVAEDVVPTEANLADATWLSNHGVAAASVKKASMQTGAAGIGEYRVSLTTTAAALSNAPAFSVAVAEGAVANYGFERTSEALQAWRLTDTAGIRAAGDRAFPGSTTVAPAPCEGTNSLFVPSGNVGGTGGGGAIGAPQSQVILFENTAHVAPKVGGSFWYYKVKNTSSPRVRISAYPNENMVAEERIAFRVVNPSTDSTSAGEWHQATFEFEAIGDGNANCILLELYSGTDYSFFDDVRIGVDVGTGNLPTMRYVATGPEAQGLNAKHLFAVDADNNRAQDRMVGETAAFYTAYDITAPTPVAFKSHGKGASTDQVDDPTTQFDLTWFSNDIGPDDPNDANYQTGWSGKEVLSPWGTYRVYYTTYDPVDMEDKASKAGKSTETYLYETLIEGTDAQGRPKYHGAGWKHVENGAEIEDVTAPAVGGKRKYSGWDQITKDANNQQTVRLYDLDFDQEYVVVVVGVDKAGNEGPVNSSSWATNNTIKFSLTRGWHVPKADAVTALEGRVSDIGQRLTNTVVSALEWTAAGMTRNAETGEMEGEATKDYDLLQWDARNFRESPDNEWKLLQTVKTNWFVDDGGPTQRGDIRFYRASYKDRWKKAVTNNVDGTDVVTAQTPLVSEEVYAQTAVRLRPGQNFTALHGVPYTNTFRGVFGGLDEFPGGNSSSDGTVIDFYEPNAKETKTESYWLHQSGNWLLEGGDGKPVNDIVQDRNFFTRAFSIQLPNTIPDKYVAGVQTNMHGSKPEEVPYLLWKPIAQVPTNGFSRVVECGTAKAPKYNIVALRLPVATHPSKMNLIESGFAQGYPWEADQIYTIDTLTREPGHSCYCDPEGNWQYVAGGNVPWDYFKPNDVLVIVSKNKPFGDETSTSTSWTWTYDPKKFYTLPNRHMQAE